MKLGNSGSFAVQTQSRPITLPPAGARITLFLPWYLDAGINSIYHISGSRLYTHMFMPLCSADSLIIWVNALIIWVNALYDSQSAAGPASDKAAGISKMISSPQKPMCHSQGSSFSTKCTETYVPPSREFL